MVIMTREQIQISVSEILERISGVQFSNITICSRLAEDFGFDGLDFVQLIMECENHFNISIPDEKCKNIFTVEQVIDLLDEVINGKTIKVKQKKEFFTRVDVEKILWSACEQAKINQELCKTFESKKWFDENY